MCKAPHVVVADDDDRVRAVITASLARWFPTLTITAVRDGQSAFRLCVSEPVSLLITDYHMPQLDGVELAYSLRAWGAAFPIVLVSGMLPEPRLLHSAGVDHAFSKPWNERELRQALRDLLQI